jgi:hypothetical protein
MIVHRRVKCPHPSGGNSERYYIETSSLIPFASTDTPTMAICLAILLTTLKVLPDIPTLPSEEAPTPYTTDSPTDDGQARFLVTPHFLSAGQRQAHVHFDIPGFAGDTLFAAKLFVTQWSRPSARWETMYGKWVEEVRSKRLGPTDIGDRRALAPEEYSTLNNWPDTVHLTRVDSGVEPEMTFTGRLGDKPIQAWYSSPKMTFMEFNLARQAFLFRNNLAHLQGKIVPRFYGLYLAASKCWSLLVTEDCGPSVWRLASGGLPEHERCVDS